MTLERSEIRRRLEELAEPGYRDFNCKLLPGVEDMLGVRTPALRRLAREIAKGDWRGYVDQVRTAWQQGEACHEERLLWGMVVGAPLLSGISTIFQVLPWSSEMRKAVGSPVSPSSESVQIQFPKIQRPLESTWMG